MTEHDHAHAGTLSTPVTRNEDLAPGRASKSSSMNGPTHPIISGLIARKAERDANGVEAGADQAIATAASSSGMSLPTPIMRKFESSLGTDLSSVRVHTGAESQSAASAVGAKAYTMGQDIHFGAGHYDPSSRAGQHLLAHEVAHTVQQRGGTSTRQNKLEVSGPQDAAEHEADRAADAMVTGSTTAIAGHAPASVARLVSDNALDQAATSAQAEQQNAPPDRIGGLSVANDTASAKQMLAMIHGWDDDMQEALKTKDATPLDVQQNNNAEQQLEEYLGALTGESVGLGNFQVLYKRSQIEYARLNAMALHAGSGLAGANKGPNAASGTGTAKDNIDNAAGKNDATTALAARAEQLANQPGNELLKAKLVNLKADTAPLDAQTHKVVTSEGETTNSVIGVMAASDQITGAGAQIKSTQLKNEFEKVKKEIEENKEKVKLAVEGMMLAFEAATDPEKAAEMITKKAIDKLAPLALNSMLGLKLTPEQEKDGQNADIQADKANVANLLGAKNAYLKATNDVKLKLAAFGNEIATLSQMKKAHAASLRELGSMLDAADAKSAGKKRKPGELGPYEAITTFLAQADAFIAEATAARDVGRQESDDVSSDAGGAAKNLKNKLYDGVLWLDVRIPSPWKDYASGAALTRWLLASQKLSVTIGGKGSAQSSKQEAGANADVQTASADLDKWIQAIAAYRDQLRKSLDVA
ncbi:MAG: DUF4157 domain-containing protein [Deltaproteobacteria bacterium]